MYSSPLFITTLTLGILIVLLVILYYIIWAYSRRYKKRTSKPDEAKLKGEKLDLTKDDFNVSK